MGTVILHPGMGKAGSSSSQVWLAANVARLRERGICVLSAPPDRREGTADAVLAPYESGPANSNSVLDAWEAGGDEKARLLDAFFAQIEAFAERNRVTVVSAEAMSVYFWRVDAPFLSRLELLGSRHPVRVAFYVRPQHTSLEAGWRQWGFRTGLSPARFVFEHSWSHHYLDTYASVGRLVPSVSFEPRPFRRDLLDMGDPAMDFARRFLEMEASGSERPGETWANPGLPLELVNALRLAPDEAFWSSPHDNRRLDRLKGFLTELHGPESEEVRRSRRVLQAYAHATFEAGNKRLIGALGWETDAFVPPPDPGEDGVEADLAILDELWRPRASGRELDALYSALRHVLASPEPPDPAVDAELRHELGAAREAHSGLERDLEAAGAELERSRADLGRLRADLQRDLAGARTELERLRAGRSGRLARARALLGPPPRDPAVALSRHLRKAAKRLDAIGGKSSADDLR